MEILLGNGRIIDY